MPRMYGNQPGVEPTPGVPPPTAPAPMPGPAMPPGQRMYGNQPGVTQAAPAAPPPAAAPSAWGGYRPEGFDQGKIDRGHDSPKYQIGRVLSNHDYKQGITPQILEQLNALGIGQFSSNGKDKISVGGANVDPRFGGVTTFDIIRNFAGGGDAWQFGDVGGPGAAGPTGQAQGSMQAPGQSLMDTYGQSTLFNRLVNPEQAALSARGDAIQEMLGETLTTPPVRR